MQTGKIASTISQESALQISCEWFSRRLTQSCEWKPFTANSARVGPWDPRASKHICNFFRFAHIFIRVGTKCGSTNTNQYAAHMNHEYPIMTFIFRATALCACAHKCEICCYTATPVYIRRESRKLKAKYRTGSTRPVHHEMRVLFELNWHYRNHIIFNTYARAVRAMCASSTHAPLFVHL